MVSRKKVDIALLEETHTIEEDIHRVRNSIYKVAAYSFSKSKNKGVIIIICKCLNLLIIKTDSDGRIINLQGVCCCRKIGLVSCYSPNSYESLFESLSNIISDMADYDIIFGGDMNAVIEHC